MLLFGEWYLLLYIYCSSSTIAYSNAHYIIISRSVLSPSQMLLQDIVQIMCRSIIVVIKYYMDYNKIHALCQYREWSAYINRSAFRIDDTNIYASNTQQNGT